MAGPERIGEPDTPLDQADEHDVGDAAVALDDLVGDALHRPVTSTCDST